MNSFASADNTDVDTTPASTTSVTVHSQLFYWDYNVTGSQLLEPKSTAFPFTREVTFRTATALPSCTVINNDCLACTHTLSNC